MVKAVVMKILFLAVDFVGTIATKPLNRFGPNVEERCKLRFQEFGRFVGNIHQ